MTPNSQGSTRSSAYSPTTVGTAGPGHEQAGHRHRRQGAALRAQVREGLPGQQPRAVLTGGSGASRGNRRNRGTAQAQRHGAVAAVRLARRRGRRPAEGGRAQPGKPAQPAGPMHPPRVTAKHGDDAEQQPQRAEVQNLLEDGVDAQREHAGHDARRIGHGRGHRRRQRPPENRRGPGDDAAAEQQQREQAEHASLAQRREEVVMRLVGVRVKPGRRATAWCSPDRDRPRRRRAGTARWTPG